MRSALAKRLIILAVVVLAFASIVSSLSIPHKRGAGVEVHANGHVKRGSTTKKAHIAAATSSTKPKTTAVSHSSVAASSHPASSSSPSSSMVVSISAPASSTPMTTSMNATTSSNMTMAANLTSSGIVPTNTTAPASNQTAAPSSGLSSGAVAGIAGVGGVAIIGAAVFAVMRYRRKASVTQTLGNKSVNQFNPSPYPGASPFPAGNNTGYERLSDPSLSGVSAPVSVVPQNLGTYNVISTYTPTLDDELEIQPGDKVTILVEYDDGWCQGINESRGKVKGVFPKHCVDYGNQGGMDEAVRGKRVSSMYGSGGYRM